MDLITALDRLRQKEKQSDAAFAARLHIGRSTWQAYRAGTPFSLAFAQTAVGLYPELRGLAEAFFSPQNAANAAKVLERRRKRKQRGVPAPSPAPRRPLGR